jgi:glycosyltransferase involved in cell wall biosynthesis
VFFHPSPKNLSHQKSWIVKKGRELIKEHKHDMITAHDYPPFYNGKGVRKLSRKTGVPYALEVHHIVGYPKAANWQERIGSFWSRFYFKGASRRAKLVRTVNSHVTKTLRKWGVSQDKIAVVPSFYLDRELIESVKKPPIAYDIGFCARLVANKGLLKVIIATRKIPNCRLLIVGDGPEREKAEKYVKDLELEGHVTFSGWLETQEAVLEALTTCRTFVVMSSSEGGPRIGLEAMACGIPVISTRVGIMQEVIVDGENGVFTTGEVDDLVAKVNELLSDEPKRSDIGKKAVAVMTHFERSRLLKEYAEFLKSLAR